MEELAEGIHDFVKNINFSTRKKLDITIDLLENGINRSRECPMDMAEATVFIFYLLFGLHNLDMGKWTKTFTTSLANLGMPHLCGFWRNGSPGTPTLVPSSPPIQCSCNLDSSFYNFKPSLELKRLAYKTKICLDISLH